MSRAPLDGIDTTIRPRYLNDMRWLKIGLSFANVGMFVLLFLLLDAQGAGFLRAGAWEYKDLVAVLLTVVSIMVTFIGIIVAVAAIWGFQTLKGMAEEKAIEASKAGSAAYLQSEGFQIAIQAQIGSAMQTAARDAVQDALAPVILRADAAPEHRVEDEPWRD